MRSGYTGSKSKNIDIPTSSGATVTPVLPTPSVPHDFCYRGFGFTYGHHLRYPPDYLPPKTWWRVLFKRPYYSEDK